MRYYTVREISERLHFRTETVLRMIAAGSIAAIRITPNGNYRIAESELDRLLIGAQPAPPAEVTTQTTG